MWLELSKERGAALRGPSVAPHKSQHRAEKDQHFCKAPAAVIHPDAERRHPAELDGHHGLVPGDRPEQLQQPITAD